MKANVASNTSAACMKFVDAVICPSAADRLDLKGMKKHSWFKGFDWSSLEAGNLESPHAEIISQTAADWESKDEDGPTFGPSKKKLDHGVFKDF